MSDGATFLKKNTCNQLCSTTEVDNFNCVMQAVNTRKTHNIVTTENTAVVFIVYFP